jgi:hypothetical protein
MFRKSNNGEPHVFGIFKIKKIANKILIQFRPFLTKLASIWQNINFVMIICHLATQKRGFMTFTKDFLIESGQSDHISWKEKS